MNKLVIRTALIFALLGVIGGNGFAAASASAGNTTGVTCNPTTGGGGFSDSHCVTKVTDGATFLHQSLPENTSLPISVTAVGSTTVRSSSGSFSVSIQCTSGSGAGILNTQGGAEMYSWGTAEITFSGCTVLSPGGFGCTVPGGTLKTSHLLFTTKGSGMGVKFSPETGTEFANIELEHCSGAAAGLNGPWALTGTVVLTPHGATLNVTHAESTTQETLKSFENNLAGIGTSLTLKGKVSGAGIAWTT